MKPVDPQLFTATTNSQRIASVLREELIERQLAPGDRLTVAELCARFGVSGAPVREALQQLGAEGYVELLPNRGAIARTFGIQQLEQVFAVREALEALQAERFAIVATDAELDNLASIARKFVDEAKGVHSPRSTRLNAEFHQIINRHDSNTELLGILERHQGLSRMMRKDFGQSPGRAVAAAKEHLELVDALRARDPRMAREVAALHVRGTLADIIECYKAKAALSAAGS